MAVLSLPSTAASRNSSARAGHATLPPVTEYDSLLVSKTSSRRVFLGTQHGLFETIDGGRSWRRAGLRDESVTSLLQIGQTILAGGRNLLAASNDGGATWRRLHPRGLPGEEIAALATEAGRSTTVYVVLDGGGLYRSSDKARTFSPVSLSVGPAVKALAVTPEHIIAGDVVTGVYLSPNGERWLHAARGMIMALAVSGKDQSQVLAASYGIARSSDGGRFWRTTMRSQVMFGAVAWAPGRSSLAYAVGDDRSFWRSTDGGVEWTRVPTR